MTINFDIPNEKAATLLDVLAAGYGLAVPEKAADKAALLNKIIKHQTIELYRNYEREKAVALVNQQLKVDDDVKETELEADLKAQALSNRVQQAQ